MSRDLITLSFFVVMVAAASAAAVFLRNGMFALDRFGLGRPEEDLRRARRIMRDGGLAFLLLIAALIAAFVAGQRWSPQWRSPHTAWVLDVLAIVTGGTALAGWAYSVHSQWSRNGGCRGMALGGLISVCMSVVCVLVLIWRFGT